MFLVDPLLDDSRALGDFDYKIKGVNANVTIDIISKCNLGGTK